MSESLGTDRIELCAGPFCFTETWHAPALLLGAHEHARACLHVVLAGRYAETIAGREQVFEPGTALYKPAGVRHSNRFPDSGARTLRIELEPRFEELFGASRPLRSAHPRLELLARQLHGELVAADDLTPLALEGLGRELIALFLRQGRRPPGDRRVAEQCAACLRQRFRERVCLGALARELGCERTALSRAFRACFRVSMGEYVRALRVAEVMRRLERGGTPLADVALQSGFADQSHCTRVFRRLTGATPAAWARGRRRS